MRDVDKPTEPGDQAGENPASPGELVPGPLSE